MSGLIATGASDQSVRVWDSEGALLLNLVHASVVHDLAWSPDGAHLAVANREEVIIYDMVDGSSALLPISNGFATISWSSDGTQLAGGAWHRVTIWDAATNQLLYDARSETGTTRMVDLADDGRILAATSDGYVVEWDSTVLAEPTVVALFPEENYDASLGYIDRSAPDSEIYVGMPGQPILFIDPASDAIVRSLDDLWHPTGLDLSPDGTRLLSIGQTSLVRLWDLTSGEMVQQFIPTFPNAFAISWAPDGENFAVTGNEGRAYLYSIADFDRVTTIELRVPQE